MFDANHDGKIFWSEFKKGIEVCMLDNETGLDSFIFNFFSINEYVAVDFLSCSRSEIDFDEFQSVLQHLPPSIFFVILKSAENRSDYAQSGIGRCS